MSDRYAVVSGDQFFEYASGHWHYVSKKDVIRGSTPTITEAMRKLEHAKSDGMPARIVKVSLTIEEVSDDELTKARFAKAQSIMASLSDTDREILKEFLEFKGPEKEKLPILEFEVSSDSHSGSYLVNKEHDGSWTCTCEDFRYRTRKDGCKHIQRAQRALYSNFTHPGVRFKKDRREGTTV